MSQCLAACVSEMPQTAECEAAHDEILYDMVKVRVRLSFQMLQQQQEIRQSANEVQEYLKSMGEWEQNMQRKAAETREKEKNVSYFLCLN